MKTIIIILAILMLIPAVWAGNGNSEDKLVVDNAKDSGAFIHNLQYGDKKNSFSKKGGYYSIKWKGQSLYLFSKAKTQKAFLNLDNYQAVSVDVRIKDPLPPTTRLAIQFNQWENGDKCWLGMIPSDSIPANGKWVRVIAPLSILNPLGNIPPTRKDTITAAAIGVCSDIDADSYAFVDVTNLTLWKTPVDEVQVIPLDK